MLGEKTILNTESLKKAEERNDTTLHSLPEKRSSPQGARRFLVVFLWIVFTCGCVTIGAFAAWWLSLIAAGSPWAVPGFIGTAAYIFCQLVPAWLVYLAARPPRDAVPRPDTLSVDVFLPVYKEPIPLVEKCLAAACRMKGDCRIYVLDDGEDPEVAALAARYGVTYLTRPGSQHAKAGNVNAALKQTRGDIIALFDIDHVPEPQYLERTLGYFADPAIGFVQVMVTFRNASENWIAQAVNETSLDFYNPTSLGMDALGGVTKMGTNSLIRRTALESIGGYKPGLAEDLATSIELHAAGWQSVYVAEPLAPGLAPASVVSWFTQQLKWARGVFEVLLTSYPRLFRRLSPWQRLCYIIRTTNYWIGPAIAINLLVVVSFLSQQLVAPSPANQFVMETYLLLLLVLALCHLLMRATAMTIWRYPALKPTSAWRAISLVYFTWPIYSLAWIMAILRVPLGFRPTPKGPEDRLNLIWITPQLLMLVVLIGLLAGYNISDGDQWQQLPLTLGLALAHLGLPFLVLCQRFRATRIVRMTQSKWDHLRSMLSKAAR